MEKQLEILILEDDPADAFRVQQELKAQGLSFHSRCVVSRPEFLKALQQQPPDIILSDHGLPSFTGFAALELSQERCPHVPFIFVTGHYDQGMMVEMFESGATGYVYKNRLQDLLPAIRKALGEARRRKAEAVENRNASSSPARSGNPGAPGPAPARELRLICAQCRKVRAESGKWEELDSYLRKHRQATITLALCPECADKRQPFFDF